MVKALIALYVATALVLWPLFTRQLYTRLDLFSPTAGDYAAYAILGLAVAVFCPAIVFGLFFVGLGKLFTKGL